MRTRANLEHTRARRLGEALIARADEAEAASVVRNTKVIIDLDHDDREALVHVGVSDGIIGFEDWI